MVQPYLHGSTFAVVRCEKAYRHKPIHEVKIQRYPRKCLPCSRTRFSCLLLFISCIHVLYLNVDGYNFYLFIISNVSKVTGANFQRMAVFYCNCVIIVNVDYT